MLFPSSAQVGKPAPPPQSRTAFDSTSGDHPFVNLIKSIQQSKLPPTPVQPTPQETVNPVYQQYMMNAMKLLNPNLYGGGTR